MYKISAWSAATGTFRILVAGLLVGTGLGTGACSTHKSSPPAQAPAPDPGDPTVPLSFAIAQDFLSLLGDQPVRLRIRIFTATDGTAGGQEGSDAVFPITAAQTSYEVDSVHLGEKNIELAVLDKSGTVLGQGSKMHYLVKPGPQTISDIVITLLQPVDQHRDLPVSLNVQVQTSSAPPPTTYLDVKPLLDGHCVHCHSTANAGGTPAFKLDLSTFPFVLTGFNEAQIVSDIIGQMKGGLMPLPGDPGNSPVSADGQALFKKWLADKLPAAPAGDDTAGLAETINLGWKLEGGPDAGQMTLTRGTDAAATFVGTCKHLVTQGKYDFVMNVIASDGTQTYSTSVTGFVVDTNNTFHQVLTVPYQQPDVTIPVVIQ